MNISPAYKLLEAINSALKDNEELLAHNADIKIYDDVHQYAKFPFITIGDLTERDNSTSSETGFEFDIKLHIFSRYHGRAEIYKIANIIYNHLHNAELSIKSDDLTLVNMHYRSLNTIKDPDGKTYHGILDYRAVIDEISTLATAIPA